MVTRPDRVGAWSPAALADACHGKLVRSGRDANAIATDTRESMRGACFVALRGERFDGHAFVDEAFRRGAAGIVVETSLDGLQVPDRSFVIRVENTREALVEIARAHRRRCTAAVVGITGSCGKTSTKDMLAHVVGAFSKTVASPASFNNDIGVPRTLLQMQPSTESAVVEIGTSGPGEVERLSRLARPDIAIVTCVAPAHLDGLGDLDGVAREKGGLLRGTRCDAHAILNRDDLKVRAMASLHPGPVTMVGVGAPDARTGSARAHDLWAQDVRFLRHGDQFLAVRR